jgi:hypothetical protein
MICGGGQAEADQVDAIVALGLDDARHALHDAFVDRL